MFKSHPYQTIAKSGNRDRFPFKGGLAVVRAAVSTAFFVLMLQDAGVASAQEPAASEPAMELSSPDASEYLNDGASIDLERAFWLCDYSATRKGVDLGTALACSEITENLKATKFNDDFESMLAWWERNKATEHAQFELTGDADMVP